MPKVTDEHREAMRTRIQDAALACFFRKGFVGASMADIIKEADLSAGAVYVYYSSKAELTLDAARRIMEQRAAELQDFGTADEVPPPHEVFPKLLDTILHDAPFAPLLLQVWGEASHSPDFATIAAEIYHELIARFEAYLNVYFRRSAGLAEGVAQARAHQIAPAVLALMQGAIVQTAIFGDASHARITDAVEAMFAQLVD
ncbi:TetR/AcrR family transcriptional regulator [Brevibacterium sp. UCMA 11752]|uniref:TetR/AcrR family transcriptional regulator n=1 Tax=Brevibacterium sp. UCMA 11752 TaxID=2745946 RepID=UPI001F33AF03|nr:TetR/AcrR family transcriptional regulator [Brevibacterium sp. UCMA 11752]MCF2588626.1 TetR/AcrR family transcriptional regulator [Brevibacterium sp. UCMA 11752]